MSKLSKLSTLHNLSNYVMSVLTEYKRLLKSTSDYMTVYQTATTSYEVLLQGIKVDVVSDGEKYYMFNASASFFYWGNIDNKDFIQTVIDDIKRIGFVMLALEYLDNEKLIFSLMKAYEAEFYEQLVYVLGYCTVKLDDGTSLLLREYIEFFSEGPLQLSS